MRPEVVDVVRRMKAYPTRPPQQPKRGGGAAANKSCRIQEVQLNRRGTREGRRKGGLDRASWIA